MLISDGWAAPFQKLTAETPVVARLFSQNLFDRFSAREGDKLFSLERVPKRQYRDLIDDAVVPWRHRRYRRGPPACQTTQAHAWQVAAPLHDVDSGSARIHPPTPRPLPSPAPPKDAEAAGDRLGGHRRARDGASPPSAQRLHAAGAGPPLARVPSSSPRTSAGADRRVDALPVAGDERRWQIVCEGRIGRIGGGTRRRDPRPVAQEALKKDVRTYLLAFGGDGKVRSSDISSLDPGDESDDVSGWGGLTGFSSRFADAVRHAVNEQESP